VDFVDVRPDDAAKLKELLPVLQELRPHLTEASFAAIYAEGHPQGLRFTALYEQDRCVAVAGWRLVATTIAGRKLYVDDLVTTSSMRSRGAGGALLAELTSRARAAGCAMLDLDSNVERHDAHRFYFRERMPIRAYHFVRPLS